MALSYALRTVGYSLKMVKSNQCLYPTHQFLNLGSTLYSIQMPENTASVWEHYGRHCIPNHGAVPVVGENRHYYSVINWPSDRINGLTRSFSFCRRDTDLFWVDGGSEAGALWGKGFVLHFRLAQLAHFSGRIPGSSLGWTFTRPVS